jgi:hypothetical protein
MLQRKPNAGQFQKGNTIGARGRPPGARSRLSETALQMLGQHFEKYGEDAIHRVYQEKPHVYLTVVASLLPKQVMLEKTSQLGELTDQELHEIEEMLKVSRAKLVQQIEQLKPREQNQVSIEPENLEISPVVEPTK